MYVAGYTLAIVLVGMDSKNGSSKTFPSTTITLNV